MQIVEGGYEPILVLITFDRGVFPLHIHLVLSYNYQQVKYYISSLKKGPLIYFKEANLI
jgi:hypothetical protein